jgi:2-dehydro-3-deoxyphosphogalactonate aldolase
VAVHGAGALLDDYLAPLPLVPILRGITLPEAAPIGDALVAEGFRILEVPLNSPDPFSSIETIARRAGEQLLVGAGTVLRADDVARLAAAGGRLVVMPHGDPAVIAEAKRRGLACMPGVATPTEAFAALAAGADALKLFPAELIQPSVVKAIRAVLPKDCRLFPVGGITPDSMAPFVAAGADGFGIGSALYKPGLGVDEVRARARAFARAWRAIGAG